MYDEITSLEIYRDNLCRITSRITKQSNGVISSSIIYLYNNNGDLHQVNYLQDGENIGVINYQYEYDIYSNKTKKIVENSHRIGNPRGKSTAEYDQSKSIYTYINEYDGSKITKKSCFYENTKQYENLYYYSGNKLIRAEKYCGQDELTLWLTEQYSYIGNIVEKVVYLANGILSYYNIIELNRDIIVRKSFRNPTKSEHYWSINNFDSNFCSIYVSENYLSADILVEILKHINSLKRNEAERIFTVIESSETIIDLSDKAIVKILQRFEKLGIDVQYSP